MDNTNKINIYEWKTELDPEVHGFLISFRFFIFCFKFKKNSSDLIFWRNSKPTKTHTKKRIAFKIKSENLINKKNLIYRIEKMTSSSYQVSFCLEINEADECENIRY